MKIYGVTAIDTDSIDGWTGKESCTWLFKTEAEQMEKAWDFFKHSFLNSFLDVQEDWDGNTLPEKDDFIKGLNEVGYDFFTRSDSHLQIEIFETEL